MAPRGGKGNDGIMAAAVSVQEQAEATYEEMRQKNIDENKAMLQKLLSELGGMPGIPMLKKSTKKSPAKKDKPYRPSLDSSAASRRRNPERLARNSPGKLAVRTRSMRLKRKQKKEQKALEVDVGDEDEVFSDSNKKSGQKLTIKFGLFGKRKAKSSDGNSDPDDDDDYSNSDSEYELYEEELPSPKKRRRVVHQRAEPTAPRPVEDVTQEEMDMVADSVKDKEYDSTATGSTCHQCRQKTNDMKTICRSGLCFGVRGQFCGPCLRNRYGEDAKAALKDPNWSCPPCRGVCNCSFCRKKEGRHATGILIHLAKHNGYSNVMEYLQSFKL